MNVQRTSPLVKFIGVLGTLAGAGFLGDETTIPSNIAHAQTPLIKELKKDSAITYEEEVEAINKFAPSTGAVIGQFGQGSYSCISVKDKEGNDKMLLLSVEHVVSDVTLKNLDGSTVQVSNALQEDGMFGIRPYDGSDFGKSEQFLAPVLGFDKHYDLAVLDPSGNHLPPIKMRNLIKHPLKVGERGFLIGNGQGLKDTLVPFRISHLNRLTKWYYYPNIQLYGIFPGGNSGAGAVVLRKDKETGEVIPELIGVLHSNVGVGQAQVLPITFVKRFLEPLGYKALDPDERQAWREESLAQLERFMFPLPVHGNPAVTGPILGYVPSKLIPLKH
ncbi:MAG: trypsin-like peptidase domain-containing protein [Candidatus Melainabacteria bacterium]|nr:trypsin-like peptidase domain-containing protein [Candidatus Melainabacteria bacterium]